MVALTYPPSHSLTRTLFLSHTIIISLLTLVENPCCPSLQHLNLLRQCHSAQEQNDGWEEKFVFKKGGQRCTGRYLFYTEDDDDYHDDDGDDDEDDDDERGK